MKDEATEPNSICQSYKNVAVRWTLSKGDIPEYNMCCSAEEDTALLCVCEQLKVSADWNYKKGQQYKLTWK